MELSEFCGAISLWEINGVVELSLHILKLSRNICLYFAESILLFLLFYKKVKIDHFPYTEKISDLIPFLRDIWIPYPAIISWPIPNPADIWIPNPAMIFEPIPYLADKKGLIPHPEKPHRGPLICMMQPVTERWIYTSFLTIAWYQVIWGSNTLLNVFGLLVIDLSLWTIIWFSFYDYMILTDCWRSQ